MSSETETSEKEKPKATSTAVKDRGVWTEATINQLYVSCDDGIII